LPLWTPPVFPLDNPVSCLLGMYGKSSLKPCARILDHLTRFKGDFFICRSA
jgi:hypothetical protein